MLKSIRTSVILTFMFTCSAYGGDYEVNSTLDLDHLLKRSSKSTVYASAGEAEQNCDDGLVEIYERNESNYPVSWICVDLPPATSVSQEIFGKEASDKARGEYLENLGKPYGVEQQEQETNPFGDAESDERSAANPFGSDNDAEDPTKNPFDTAAGEENSRAARSASCTVSRLDDTTSLCVGTNDQCKCLVAQNSCPYPVRVVWQADGRKPMRNALEPGKSQKFCATGNGTQEVRYFGWYPEGKHPLPGEPLPSKD